MTRTKYLLHRPPRSALGTRRIASLTVAGILVAGLLGVGGPAGAAAAKTTKPAKKTTKTVKTTKPKLPAPDLELACIFMMLRVSTAVGQDPKLERVGPSLSARHPRAGACDLSFGSDTGWVQISVYANATDYKARAGTCPTPPSIPTEPAGLGEESFAWKDPLYPRAGGCAWAKGAVYRADLAGDLATSENIVKILAGLLELNLATLPLPYVNTYKG